MTTLKRLYNATKFNLRFYIMQLVMFVAVAIINIIIAAIVSANTNGNSGSLDSMAIIWVAIVGASGFFYYFKFLLINGYSRKDIFIICLSALIFLSFCWAVITSVLMITAKELSIRMYNIFFFMYPQSNYGTMFLWILFTLPTFALLSLFITLIFYRAGKKVRWGLFAGIFLAAPVGFLIDLVSDGGFFRALGQFFIKIFGFSQSIPNPFIFVATMAVISALSLIGSFLLIRRAQIKEM